MPESMFGRPLQHLLPSQPQASSTGVREGPSDLHTAPVQHPPPTFKDVQFEKIGKPPELLNRISFLQPDNTDYRSPTPSPTSTPPPVFTNDLHSKSSSRPSLLQQLAGSDFNSTDEGLRWNPPTTQSNNSLASRIQMSGSPSYDIASAHGTASRFPTPPFRVTGDASLIPPVEVLHQLPDSSPPTPASWAPTIDPGDVYSPAYSTPLVNTTTVPASRMPTPPTVTMGTASKEPMEPFPSSVVPDSEVPDVQLLPSATTAIDVLVTRQGRLQSISTRLANLAAPIHPSPPQSPPLHTSSITRASADITLSRSSQSQPTTSSIVLHHPYLADQSSNSAALGINDTQTPSGESCLALIPSPVNLTQVETQSRAIVAAFQNLESALNTAHRAQINNKNALASQLRAFEDQRAAFEQTKRSEENKLQQGFRELQQKREALDAKAATLAALEKENTAREEARRAVLAKRQAQEEEKRAIEAKRVQEVQEQIETAMNELKEIESLKAKCQVEQLVIETVQDDLPTEPRGDMNEEEGTAIKSRNELLLAVKHLRRMHADKVQKLEEANRTLRRLGVERKNREVEEAECRRAAEERLQSQLQIAPARQLEMETKCREDQNGREQARLLVEQQAHAEAQAHGFGRKEATNGQGLVYLSHPGEVGASQRREIAGTTRIRVAREENSVSPGITDAMNVDRDAFRAVPSPDIRTSPGMSPSKRKKKGKPISGGVMLAASNPTASGARLPLKPQTTPASLPSSDHVAENTPNPLNPVIPVSADRGHGSSLPTQFAPEINRGPSTDICRTPDYKSAFSRTPKSQTILDTNGGSQELNIGPVAGVSPTQQNVNLRHLKRYRSRAEGSDDRSVRTIQVKSEENFHLSPKREEHDEQARQVTQARIPNNVPASLPSRPVIAPPRPRTSKKRPAAVDLSTSYPLESNELSSQRRGMEVTTVEHPREAPPQDTMRSQEINPPDQLPALSETTRSLLLGPVYAEPQGSELRSNIGDRPTLDRGENYETTRSEPASAALSHDMEGEDSSRSNRKSNDERRQARNSNGSRWAPDRYSPPLTSPTQAHRPSDTRRPPNPSSGPRAEPMRATSPIAGRKRPSEFNDNEHGRRARRRGDVWTAQDHDRDQVDSYRPHWDRRLDSETDERCAAYRSPTSHDRTRPYFPDVPRAPYDNGTYAPEEPAAPPARWEQSYRRAENVDAYQWYPSSAAIYNVDQHHIDDTRVGQSYEPITEERVDGQPDPSLLARIHDTQRFPPRGRGRGEGSRGRGEFGRGRGRGAARGGTPLIERLTTGPSSSLGDRLT